MAAQLTLTSLASRTAVDEKGAPFTMYAIAIRAPDGTEWVVERRFSEFRRLESRLKEAAGRRGALPPPPMPPGLGGGAAAWLSGSAANMSPELVANRVQGLDAYLRKLFAAVPSNDELLADFLQPDGPGESSTPVPKYKGYDPRAQARAAEVSAALAAPLPPLAWELIHEETNDESLGSECGAAEQEIDEAVEEVLVPEQERRDGAWERTVLELSPSKTGEADADEQTRLPMPTEGRFQPGRVLSGKEAQQQELLLLGKEEYKVRDAPRRHFFIGERIWCQPRGCRFDQAGSGCSAPSVNAEPLEPRFVIARVLARRTRHGGEEVRVRLLDDVVIGEEWISSESFRICSSQEYQGMKYNNDESGDGLPQEGHDSMIGGYIEGGGMYNGCIEGDVEHELRHNVDSTKRAHDNPALHEGGDGQIHASPRQVGRTKARQESGGSQALDGDDSEVEADESQYSSAEEPDEGEEGYSTEQCVRESDADMGHFGKEYDVAE